MADDIERLATLLSALPPAPQGWVEAAQLLPRMRRQLDGLLARAEVDAAVRARLEADLESMLTESGITPTARIVDEVRERMRSF
jgi:hypothetical protein